MASEISDNTISDNTINPEVKMASSSSSTSSSIITDDILHQYVSIDEEISDLNIRITNRVRENMLLKNDKLDGLVIVNQSPDPNAPGSVTVPAAAPTMGGRTATFTTEQIDQKVTDNQKYIKILIDRKSDLESQIPNVV